jgi:hypothetical protein
MIARLLGSLALASAVLVPIASAPAATAAPVRADDRAFSDIAGCISSADTVLVSVVVDESASLETTDPDDLRVRGIGTAVDSLEQLAEQVGESTEVHVSLSTFARSFDTLVDWHRLDADTGQQLRSAAEEELPGRNTGDATDYRQALLGAQGQLAERQREVRDPDACKVLLWFTDGALDVDEQTGTAASQLCQSGGILDAVRRDRVTVIALALLTPGGGVSDAQRGQLRAVAEGRGGGSTCGTTPVPPQYASGIYLPADDPAVLQQLFGSVGALVGGGTPVGEITCPGPRCPGGRYSLAIDSGVAGARVLVAPRGGASEVELTSPSGRTVDLGPEGTEVDGATVSLVRRDGFATLDVSYPKYPEERAEWQLRPGPSRLSVFWFWGAQLDLESAEARAGGSNDFRLQLRDRNDAPLPPTLYSDFRVQARVGSRPVRARLTPDGEVVGSFGMGVDRIPQTLPLRVSVTARSRPGGVRLGPLAVTERLDVELPPVYPGLSPDVLDFGSLEGEGSVSTELRAAGSPVGPTRACVVGSRVGVPGREPSDLVTPAQRCLRLGPGEEGALDLRLTPGTSADGVASGHVTLRLHPADDSSPLEVEVPVELEMQRIVDESTRWLLVALLLALALLLPLGVLLLANWLTATFSMTFASRIGSAPVRVTPRGLVSRDSEELIGPDDFHNAGFSGRRTERHMPLGHTRVTAQVRDAVGLRDARGVAVGPEKALLVSGTTPYRGDNTNEAPMTLGDVDSVLVLVEPTDDPHEAAGTLVMVVPGNVDNDGIRDRAQEASNRVDWEKVLVEATREQPQTATTAPATASTADPDRTGPQEAAGASSEERRESFPWEDDADPGTPGPSRTSHSRGKRRRGASDSTQESTDRRTGGSEVGGDPAGPDDDLPPLPDFLKEE